MEVALAMELRNDLEESIKKLVVNFEEATGLEITSIEIQRLYLQGGETPVYTISTGTALKRKPYYTCGLAGGR